jgi:hypothetical protein
MRSYVLVSSLTIFFVGCATSTVHSFDGSANYGHSFSHVSALQPTIVHGHVERSQGSVLGLFPLPSEYNGDWALELLASSGWLDQLKRDFTEVPFETVSARQVPGWFFPFSEDFSAWKVQPTSYATEWRRTLYRWTR